MLKVAIEPLSDVLMTRLSGDLDRSAREDLLKTVKGEVVAKGGKVILDCENLSSLDSDGVRALLALQAWLRIKESEMVIAGLPSSLEDPIKSDPQVDSFLSRHTLEEAMAKFGVSPPAATAAPTPVQHQTSPISRPPQTTAPIASPQPLAEAIAPPYTPTPVASEPISAPPAEAPRSGGWGLPVEEHASSPLIHTQPVAASEPIQKSTPSPWESPIAAPSPVPSSSSLPKIDISSEPAVIAPPPNSWGTVAVSKELPKTPLPKATTDWPKGPPPTSGFPSNPTKSSKKPPIGLIVGVIATVIVGGIVWKFWPQAAPPVILPETTVVGIPRIEPSDHVLTGGPGVAPTPESVEFKISNVEESGIKWNPDTLSWARGETSSNEDGTITLKFAFSKLPQDLKPEERAIVISATGNGGRMEFGQVALEYQDPDVNQVEFAEQVLKAEIGSSFADTIQLIGSHEATFTGTPPEPFKLNEKGRIWAENEVAGIETGEYSFKVKATSNGTFAEKDIKLIIIEKGDAATATRLLQEIVEREKSMDREEFGNLNDSARAKLRDFEDLALPIIKKNPELYVKQAALVTFNIGKSSLDKEEEERALQQLNRAEVRDWVLANPDSVTFVVAGFADSVTGTVDVNRGIVRKRAQSMRKVVEKWLIALQSEGAIESDRIIEIPTIPSVQFDEMEKYRAAECWLVREP